MGGRGRAFLITSGLSSINFYENYNNETYTKKPTQNTDYLKNKKYTWTMSSTDKFNRTLMNSQPQFLSNLTKEQKTTSDLLSDDNNLRIRAINFKRPSIFAAFVSPANGKYEKLQIVFNNQAMDKSIKDIEKSELDYQENHQFAPSDKNMLINKTLAHEYGHFVEKTLIEQDSKDNPKLKFNNSYDYNKYYMKKSKEIYNEIYQIKKEKFDDESRKRISKYAYDNYAENFAEIFCNLTTSKNPTNWGKAMKEYLRRKGICE